MVIIFLLFKSVNIPVNAWSPAEHVSTQVLQDKQLIFILITIKAHGSISLPSRDSSLPARAKSLIYLPVLPVTLYRAVLNQLIAPTFKQQFSILLLLYATECKRLTMPTPPSYLPEACISRQQTEVKTRARWLHRWSTSCLPTVALKALASVKPPRGRRSTIIACRRPGRSEKYCHWRNTRTCPCGSSRSGIARYMMAVCPHT